ncbi:DUF4232 domain-containing protein [Actinomadura rubrisoli]|uniref:DUF4232 domain-containing protein n=1 Tax=Actinomadura rubrisoli TaxID=2530368 RepID=A0A4V2YYK1_9ACTN|nr:DUF4232 domain-containing protein [Actinomadura rubrisoli]TDD93447.1 DUF4232 domain-containing protein [Actinomadura rubrisoli]
MGTVNKAHVGIRRAIGIGALGASMVFIGQMAASAENASAPAAPSEPSWCHQDDMSVTIKPGGAGAGHRYADLVLANDSDNTCSLQSYVSLRLLDAKGKPLPTRVVHLPGKPKLVTLEPFERAVTRMDWSVVPTGDEPVDRPCQPTAASLDVDLPHSTPEPGWNVVAWNYGPVCNKGTINISPILAG